MAEMSMNKVIHAAVRRDLARFVDALERFTAGDRARAAGLGRAWRNFEDELTYHHEGEHEIAWPRLREVGVSDALLAEMDQEHDVMAAALAEAGQTMAGLERSASGEDAVAALAAFRHLQEVTVRHLDHEEAELEPVYLQHRDSAPIQAMGKQFAKQSGPARGGNFFAWVTDGASPAERDSVTATIPKPVFALITGIFGRRYRREIAPVWRA